MCSDLGSQLQRGARYGALLDRVCEIYEEKTGNAIDQEVLADAFVEARDGMQSENPDGRRGRAPMARHAGILGNLGIEINHKTLKAALADAREAVQAGVDTSYRITSEPSSTRILWGYD